MQNFKENAQLHLTKVSSSVLPKCYENQQNQLKLQSLFSHKDSFFYIKKVTFSYDLRIF